MGLWNFLFFFFFAYKSHCKNTADLMFTTFTYSYYTQVLTACTE